MMEDYLTWEKTSSTTVQGFYTSLTRDGKPRTSCREPVYVISFSQVSGGCDLKNLITGQETSHSGVGEAKVFAAGDFYGFLDRYGISGDIVRHYARESLLDM